jgi:anthranilate phosphoribosyltransferase
MGAFSVRAAEMLAQVAARLGVQRAFVVHGGDGLDEVTTTTHTIVFQVEDGKVRKGRWTPSDFGLPPADPDDLKGGDPEINAAIIQSVLRGEMGGARDVVLANAAAALLIAGHASDLKTAVTVAAESIETGAAQRKLDELREFATALTHENV